MTSHFGYLARTAILTLAIFLASCVTAQRIPGAYSNIENTSEGLVLTYQDEAYGEIDQGAVFTLDAALGAPKGTRDGIAFDFQAPGLSGKLYYGFIHYNDSRHPMPVFFKRYAEVVEGEAEIDIANQLSGRYDMIGWEESGQGTMGFRLVADNGLILYDGRVSFSGTGPFKVVPTIIEGPTLHRIGPDRATIAFTTHKKTTSTVTVGDQSIESDKGTQHEVEVTGLTPGTLYDYTVNVEGFTQTYQLETAPETGTRSAFTFAYASDSRAGQGGGEREIYGANAYIMKKIMALAMQQQVKYFQFSGDLINGYLTSPEEMDLQYANWKHAVEPWWHYFPIYISMGNHEALTRVFGKEGSRLQVSVDRFPYETESAEAVFGRNVVNPRNGPAGEDGASYDPNPNRTDFPSYDENVFYYTYDNVAVIVLNSNYWYAPSTGAVQLSGGNIHAYIMDQQLAWLEQTLATLEEDSNIDHVFVTQHTPCFPNGGHVGDDMWYRGDNSKRAWVNGKPLEKGIIERRDQYLDLLVNESSKVIAILTGDEHNYALTTVSPDMDMYPEAFPETEKLELSRTIYQVNNGAAGAPYYAQEETPWSDHVSGFTTQNALVLFDVEGSSIRMRVLNPDTLEEIEQKTLRE